MARYKNHLIDPTYFYDVIEEFSFDYDLYVKSDKKMDEFHQIKNQYRLQKIRGSLQTQGLSLNMDKTGNTDTNKYKFYCKSLYRINIGDFIHYKESWLHCNSVQEYDEWGVREASLEMVNLAAYRDLEEYYKYLKGEKIV